MTSIGNPSAHAPSSRPSQSGRLPLSFAEVSAVVNPVTDSYIAEALNTFNAACFKATAVMVGAASESLVLGIRDTLSNETPDTLAQTDSIRSTADWRIKRVLSTVERNRLER